MDAVTEEDKSAFCGILQPTDTLYSVSTSTTGYVLMQSFVGNVHSAA